MRVIVLTADYPPDIWSGVGAAVELQAAALARCGVEVHVLAATPQLPTALAEQADGLFVHHLSNRRCPADPTTFDLVHLHSLPLSELALELCRRFKLPLVYTAHALLHLEIKDAPQAEFWRRIQMLALTASAHVIFLSRAEQAAGIALVPTLASYSSVIPNGVPPPQLWPEPDEEESIVFAGRFTRRKGITLFTELVPRILAQTHSRFVFAGGHGDEDGMRLIRMLVSQFPDHCHMPGWLSRDRLDQLFASAGLVLVPSLYEPFGLVALEAMRMGAPVLAADVGGLSEVVGPESGGWKIGSHDPAHWAEVVLQIIQTPAVRQHLRRQGPRYVAEHFNPMQIAQYMVNTIYANVTTDRSVCICDE